MSGAEILLQPGVFPRLLQGLWVTVWIAGVSVGASIPVGLLVGWLMTLKNPVIRAAMRIYLDFIRIMPQLALLFLAYYGFARWFDWNLDATGACVLVFILWGGAELGDLVRGALQSIPKVQYESSYVLGLSPWQTFARVILPQAVRRMLPASSKRHHWPCCSVWSRSSRSASRLSTRTDSSSRLEPCGFMA